MKIQNCVTAAALVGTLAFGAPAFGQSLLEGLTGAVVENQEQATRLVNSGLRTISCAMAPVPAGDIQFADTDRFDCTLKNALSRADGEVTVTFSGETAVAYPVDEAHFNRLPAALPDRATLWTSAVDTSNGQVASCLINRPQFWSFIIPFLIPFAERLFFNPEREQERLYRPARNYNVAVIFDAQEQEENVVLRQMVFSPRDAGPITHASCTY